MILVTGDTHGYDDIAKLDRRNFKFKDCGLTKDDYLIICGDFGMVWDNSKEDMWWRRWLEQKPYTTLFVDGNHENFDLLYEFPEEEWHGGRVHRISDSILHLMRGQVFDIQGMSFFTMGGACSHDMKYRTEGKNWWQRELPDDDEYETARKNLEKCGNKADVIITHCAPTSVEKELIQLTQNDTYTQNRLTDFLEELSKTVAYKQWFCGHYHIDKTTLTEPRLRVLYDDVVEIKEE